jgi:hypothetical protein
MEKKITDTREFYAISGNYAIYNGYEYKVELLKEKKVKLLYRITADPCTEFDAFCKCAMNVNWIFPDIIERKALDRLFYREIYTYYMGYKGYYYSETESEVWIMIADIPDKDVGHMDLDGRYDLMYYTKRLKKHDYDFYVEERDYEIPT